MRTASAGPAWRRPCHVLEADLDPRSTRDPDDAPEGVDGRLLRREVGDDEQSRCADSCRRLDQRRRVLTLADPVHLDVVHDQAQRVGRPPDAVEIGGGEHTAV